MQCGSAALRLGLLTTPQGGPGTWLPVQRAIRQVSLTDPVVQGTRAPRGPTSEDATCPSSEAVPQLEGQGTKSG